MKKLIENLPPGRIKEIDERLHRHFFLKGLHGERLECAFRNAAQDISRIAVATKIPEDDLTRFFWFMVKTQNRAMHREAEARFGSGSRGWWCNIKRRYRRVRFRHLPN